MRNTLVMMMMTNMVLPIMEVNDDDELMMIGC